MLKTVTMTDELSGKRVIILGLARQGKALARFATQAGAEVVVSDLRSPTRLQSSLEELADLSIEMVLGGHPISLLENADVLALSGGVPSDLPIVKAAYDQGVRVTNDSLEFIKRTPSTVIGITGSAGKTTTTALTGAIVRASGRRTWVGGNIGSPLIGELEKMTPDDVVVQELSSFQLELWDQSPQVAAVLNLTPNHLDRHKTMATYRRAKANILRFQQPSDVAVLSADDPGALELSQFVAGRLRLFSLYLEVEDGAFIRQGKIWLANGDRQWPVCDMEAIPLRGRHNIFNILASFLLADTVGVTTEIMAETLVSFKPVGHRLEVVRIIGGVQYINDSIATAPERAIAALESFTEPLILLAGGQDKDMSWEIWAKNVLEKSKAVVLFGELAELMERHLTLAAKSLSGTTSPVLRVETMAEALLAAHRMAKPGDIVLLAPGGTSFDAYVDFEKRGEAFREMVNVL